MSESQTLVRRSWPSWAGLGISLATTLVTGLVVWRMDQGRLHAPFPYVILLALGMGTGLVVFGLLRTQGRSERQAQTQADEHLANLTLLLASTGEAIYGTDAQGLATFCNSACVKMMGYGSGDEIIGRNLHEVFHHAYPDGTPFPASDCPLAQAYGQGVARHMGDAVFWRKDGTSFPADAWSYPQWRDGRLAGAVVTIRDLTAQRMAEQAIEESEFRFRRMFELLPVGVSLLASNGQVLLNNTAAETLLGRSAEELVLTDHRDPAWVYYHHDGSPMPAAEIPSVRALAEGRPVLGVEMGIQRPDGGVAWLSVSAEPIHQAGMGVLLVYSDIAPQREALAALQASEVRFRQLAEVFPEIIFEASLDGTLTYVNDRTLSRHGIQGKDMVLGRNLMDFVHPDDLDRVRHRLAERTSGREGGFLEYRALRPDGVVFDAMAFTSLLKDKGHLTGIRGFVLDISERKRSEEVLAHNEARLNQIIDATGVGTWEWNILTGEQHCNERWAGMLGYTLAELEPLRFETWAALVHPEDRARNQEQIERHFRGELDHVDIEIRMKHKDGSWIWVHNRGRVTAWSEAGQPLHMFGTHTEITERKRMDEQIAMERDLFVGGPVSVFLWRMDEGLSVEYVSRNVQDLLGYPAEEMMDPGFRFASIVHPEDLARIERELQGHKASNIPRFEQNYRVRHKSGTYRWVYDFNVPQRDPDGRLVGIHGYLIDLTAQKESEQRLRAINRHLELATARAREMTQVAERANASKSEFLANMSHEIRTPMNGVLGMAELLGTTTLTNEQRDFVSAIFRSGESLLSILNDILDFSKIEAGQLTLETIAFDLEQLVYDVAELFRGRMEGREVELLLDFDLSTPNQVQGDPGRIRQILSNLISNAIKFTQRGHILVKVQAEAAPAGPWNYILSVQDTGIGIARDKQVRLFKPFVQADSSTARRYGGTGLGLALVRRLVEAMKGTVELESEEGVGTTLRARIPLGVEARGGEDPLQGPVLAGRRILVVDDLTINRKLHARYLEAHGAVTAAAGSGAEALQMLFAALDEGEPFAGAVVDLYMPPGMDGETFGRMVRAEARFGSMALVVLTGTSVQGELERLAALGFDGYLHKPIKGNTLARALGTAIRRRAALETGTLVTRHTVSTEGAFQLPVTQLTLEARILLVEDQEVNQAIARKFLELAGATVAVAGNGLIALAMLKEETYDLILMDCQMPEMDGFEATLRIRAEEKRDGGHIPIVAMTAHAMAGDRDRCLLSGMDDYLTKPISREALIREVSQWLPGKTGRAAAASEGNGPAATAASAPLVPGPSPSAPGGAGLSLVSPGGAGLSLVSPGGAGLSPVSPGGAGLSPVSPGGADPSGGMPARAEALGAAEPAEPVEPAAGAGVMTVLAGGLLQAPAELKVDAAIFDSLWDVFGRDGGKMTTLVIEPYLQRGDGFLDHLRAAQAAGNRAELKAIAHTLKGSSRTLALNALGLTAEALERESAAAPAEVLDALIGTLAAQLSAAATFLNRIKDV